MPGSVLPSPGSLARTTPKPPGGVQPDTGAFNENEAFKNFDVAFPGLIGRSAMIPADDMQAFADFVLQIMYPPNPIRNLDDSLTVSQQAGKATSKFLKA